MNTTQEQEVNYDNYDVGVVIGRFQVASLHESHEKLFDTVVGNHERVICLLGLSPVKCTKRNPLDFNQRKRMINEKYPNIECHYIKDTKSNGDWSKYVDIILGDNIHPNHKALLYGSRDSFIKYYDGRHDTHELESDSFISGTELRRKITRATRSNKDFRAGACWAASSKFPINYVTVDIAIMDKDRTKLLLGRKSEEQEFRFIGGFTDPASETIELDAHREVKEETHLDISPVEYICSNKIDDWRYRNEEDKITTTFWIGDMIGGTPIPDDDIAEIKWFEMSDFIYEDGCGPLDMTVKNPQLIVDGHIPLMLELVNYLRK